MSDLTGIVSFRGSVYVPLTISSLAAGNAIREALINAGYGINHVEVNGNWFSNNADVVVNVVYICSYSQSVDAIGNNLNILINNTQYGFQSSSLRFNGWIESCTVPIEPPIPNPLPVIITPKIMPNPNPVNTGTTGTHPAPEQAGDAYLGFYNGYDYYQYSDNSGCYANTELGFLPMDCPAGANVKSGDDFLTQIGKALGFGKANAQTAGGITAATGGAIVILAALLIFSRK